PPRSAPFPYPTLFRSAALLLVLLTAGPLHGQLTPPDTTDGRELVDRVVAVVGDTVLLLSDVQEELSQMAAAGQLPNDPAARDARSEEHTSELQSRENL